GVAGIGGSLVGGRALDAGGLGDLVDDQQGSHARQVVLAGGAGRGQDVAVTLAELGDQQGNVFRQQVGVGGVVGHQHLGNTGDLGSGFRYCATAGTGNQYLDVATDGLGGRHGVQGGGIQFGVVVF